MTPPHHALLPIALVMLSACGDPAIDTPTPAPGYRVETRLIDNLGKPVWSMEVADFDGDGLQDLLLSGHRGAEGERIYPGRADGLGAPHRVLKATADRHHCAAGDVDGDGFADLYCTTGVERGSGASANELWLNTATAPQPVSFILASPGHGADEPYSRGRFAVFFRLQAQGPPALLSSVWGERADGKPNASRVWRRHDGHFEPLPVDLPRGFGGRCVAVIDLDADGSDELLGCAEERGLHLLDIGQEQRGVLRWVGDPATWWWGVAAIRITTVDEAGNPRPAALVAAVGGRPDRQFVELQRLPANGRPDWRKRIDCRVHNPDSRADTYCAAVLLHDIDADGHPDLYITRRRGWMLDVQVADTDDLIILGPDFEHYVSVPASPSGYGYASIIVNGDVIRLSAGESWGGSLERVRVMPE